MDGGTIKQNNTTERNEEKTLSQYLSVAYPNSKIEKNKDVILHLAFQTV